MNRFLAFTLLVCISATACQAPRTPLPPATSTPTYTADQLIPTPRFDPLPTATQTQTPDISVTQTILASSATFATRENLTPQSTPTDTGTPYPDGWMNLPVIPQIDSNVRKIYQLGQSLGTDPNAFSIFGDCQSIPDEFLGVFETDPDIRDGLSSDLYDTVINFQGSFNRESPTSQDGTTPGALLWDQWHRGEYGCEFGETPVSCELRIHNPSFVIIQIGTHFESRNTEYLRTIINQLLDAGVVPILGTKADNRELDNRVNRDLTMLASEFDLPLWNFWAALSDLPNRGLYVIDGREDQGAVYLDVDASEIHRMTGLEMLSAVWRAATKK